VCWLIAYPLVGQIGASAGTSAAFGSMASLAAIGTITALRLWPQMDADLLPHSHDDLAPNHPHLREQHAGDAAGHPYYIDEIHPHWPRL
jgi:hypothetical protein